MPPEGYYERHPEQFWEDARGRVWWVGSSYSASSNDDVPEVTPRVIESRPRSKLDARIYGPDEIDDLLASL